MLVYTYPDGEPRIRVVEAGGVRVVSLDVFRRLSSPPADVEWMEVGKCRVMWRRRQLMSGFCEFLYLQVGGEVQLINMKYVGPDAPEVVVEALLQLEDSPDQ